MNSAAPIELSRTDARRLALRAQALTANHPENLMEALETLRVIQLNPTAPIAPSADLVLWSRLGSDYDPGELTEKVATQQSLEFEGFLRPAVDLTLFRADMAAWPGTDPKDAWHQSGARWVEANSSARDDVLEALRADGPLPTSEVPDTCQVPWRSTGWTNHRNRAVLLQLLVRRGDIAVAGWDGPDKLWDLASRVYSSQTWPDVQEARAERARRRLRSLGIERRTPARSATLGMDQPEAADESSALPAVVEGVRGRWVIAPQMLEEAFAPRAALLSPFDRLLADRKRVTDLFGFEYVLEMFKPAAKRRWGYYALPVLVGDRLVGKLDATADHPAGLLRIHALHEDEQLSAKDRDAVEAEIEDLARWLGLLVHWDELTGMRVQ